MDITTIQAAYTAIKKIEKQYRPIVDAMVSLTEISDSIAMVEAFERKAAQLQVDVNEHSTTLAAIHEEYDTTVANHKNQLKVLKDNLDQKMAEERYEFDLEMKKMTDAKEAFAKSLIELDEQHSAAKSQYNKMIADEEAKLANIQQTVKDALAKLMP